MEEAHHFGLERAPQVDQHVPAGDQVQFGERSSPIDAVLPLLPGVPLMITKNVDRPLGKHSSSLSSMLLTYIDLVNGKIVYFHGFVDAQGK